MIILALAISFIIFVNLWNKLHGFVQLSAELIYVRCGCWHWPCESRTLSINSPSGDLAAKLLLGSKKISKVQKWYGPPVMVIKEVRTIFAGSLCQAWCVGRVWCFCIVYRYCTLIKSYSHRFWYQPVGLYTVRSTDRLAMRAFFALWIFTWGK